MEAVILTNYFAKGGEDEDETVSLWILLGAVVHYSDCILNAGVGIGIFEQGRELVCENNQG